jgi:hypothetical protein
MNRRDAVLSPVEGPRVCNHQLVSDADGDQTGEALPMPMRDTITGQRFRVVQLACEDEDHRENRALGGEGQRLRETQ